jgi:N-acyl amino acid synthase FeeM
MTTYSVKRIDAGARAGGTAHLFRGLDTRVNRARKRRGAPGTRGPASIEVPGITRKIRVKIASSREEFAEAFRLLATNYRACGYEQQSTGYFRFTPYHVLPNTVILVAKHEDRVVATLSVVPDTELCGLPMEAVYRAEIESLRQQGRRLAEATSLADQNLGIHEFVRVFKTLIRVGMQYHVRQGGDSWVIAVNPRHRGFYQKVLGFVPLGPRRAYPTVQGHPAEAYVSGVDLLRTHAPEMNREVFGALLPDSVLRAPRWSPSRVHYFGKQSTQADGRTIDDLLSHVEQFGSPPRWKGDAIRLG